MVVPSFNVVHIHTKFATSFGVGTAINHNVSMLIGVIVDIGN